MKNLLLSAICIVSLFLSSCQNWIDVNPKTDIEAEEFFTSEDGFKSALTGLYSMMVLEKSYGRQMTFDFVEKSDQGSDNYAAGTARAEERAAIYKYGETTSSKNATAELWLKLYNEIANINNFLQYLESNGDVIVTEGYRDLMKGEALGYVHSIILTCCVCGDLFIPRIRQKHVFLTGSNLIRKAHP